MGSPSKFLKSLKEIGKLVNVIFTFFKNLLSYHAAQTYQNLVLSLSKMLFQKIVLHNFIVHVHLRLYSLKRRRKICDIQVVDV